MKVGLKGKGVVEAAFGFLEFLRGPAAEEQRARPEQEGVGMCPG